MSDKSILLRMDAEDQKVPRVQLKGTERSDEATERYPHNPNGSPDGIAGLCDRHQYLCLRLALWNGCDPILKERMFGLNGDEGNYASPSPCTDGVSSALASRQRAILAARTLKAEERQNELGLQTSTEVLDAQTKLADAQSSEVRALAEYQIALVDVAFASGNLLGAAAVQWDAGDEFRQD